MNILSPAPASECPPEVRAQIVWERESVERGVRRYRSSLYDDQKDGGQRLKDLADLEPGQRIMCEVVHHSVVAIEDAQREALAGLEAKSGARGGNRMPAWWAPLLSLSAEKVAVIGVRSLLTGGASGPGRKLRSVALEIGRHMQTEREFELWRVAEDKAQKEDPARRSHWRLMKAISKEINEAAFTMWRKKSQRLDSLGWPRDIRLQAGTKVIDLIVQHGGGWFEVGLESVSRGRFRTTERFVKLTEVAQEWVKSRHLGNELNRPWLLPMICEPRPWVYNKLEKT